MLHRPSASRPTRAGNPDYFSGETWLDPLHTPEAPARAHAVSVRFAAGARTAWHTHPLGQLILITEGKGRAQTWGGEVLHLETGDTVWFPPGEKHWHGAAEDRAMTHLAIQEALDGATVAWLEHVAEAAG